MFVILVLPLSLAPSSSVSHPVSLLLSSCLSLSLSSRLSLRLSYLAFLRLSSRITLRLPTRVFFRLLSSISLRISSQSSVVSRHVPLSVPRPLSLSSSHPFLCLSSLLPISPSVFRLVPHISGRLCHIRLIITALFEQFDASRGRWPPLRRSLTSRWTVQMSGRLSRQCWRSGGTPYPRGSPVRSLDSADSPPIKVSQVEGLPRGMGIL